MLLFSTILEIQNTLTPEAFIQLVIDWNNSSIHPENIIQGIEWHGERNVRYGDDNLWMEIAEYPQKHIIAARYEKVQKDGVIWDTDYIMNFEEMRMSIQLDRSYLEEALVTNAGFSTPHFITMLIEKGYLKMDGKLAVSREPLMIDSENIELLSDVITGRVKYQLPVIYVSKTNQNQDPVATNWLAGRLKGIAHVLVQEDLSLNSSIRAACEDKNEYFGTIGIYYPNEMLGHKRCTYKGDSSSKALLEKVINFVLQFGTLQNIDKLYTWQGVNNALLLENFKIQREERLAAEVAKEKAELEVDKVYDSLDDELTSLQRRIEELTRTNESLTRENQGLRTKLAKVDVAPLLFQGDEEDFYPGEIKEFVLEILAETLKNVHPDSRKEDVLKDILSKNPYEPQGEKRRQRIKRLFKGYKNISGAMKQELAELGFEITEEGKHYKLTYKGDPRYMVTAAKTPSDNRSGDNIAQLILRNMF